MKSFVLGKHMECYVVGGFVRDLVLSRMIGTDTLPKDKDFVVVGESPESMLALGFKQVGADFPVFLHPETGDEYALARKETKDGEGYCGFKYEWEGVTLEEDLGRRDLTINAMAYGSDFEIIDPYNGLQDLENQTLRHVSDAFAEDPVRVLRVARFLAGFGPEWKVAPETYEMCQQIAWKEFHTLTAERVFKEMEKAFNEAYPWLFFEFLYMLDYTWFKEVFDLMGVPQPVKWHPENCTFKHIMLCLQQAVRLRATPEELYAVLCHDLGKAPCFEKRRKHWGHEEEGVPYVEAISDRLKVPTKFRSLAIKVCRNHLLCHRALQLNPKRVYKLFSDLNCLKDMSMLKSFIKCCKADARGRPGSEDIYYNSEDYLTECLEAVQAVNAKEIAEREMKRGRVGKAIGDAIRVVQVNAIKEVKEKWVN